MWMPEIAKAEDAGDHFTWHSWHCSGIDRKIITKGMGYFSPMRYSELPRFYRENLAPVDVVMLQTTPMDAHATSTSAWRLPPGRPDVPCQVHYRGGQREYALGVRPHRHRDQHPGRDLCRGGGQSPRGSAGRRRRATDVDRAVANLVVPQIPNGACLQLGIGGMPNTVVP